MSFLALATFGLLLGMEHALNADHVVAVSTIVSQSRSFRRSLIIGVIWGVGHTVTLLAVGAFVLLFGIALPDWVSPFAELLVGVILILFGFQIVRDYDRKRIHAHAHSHRGEVHIHFHAHEATQAHLDEHHEPHVRKPLLMGMVHGVAGSAVLLLLVVGTTPSPLMALLCVLTFGLGSIVGMLAVSALVALPFLPTLERYRQLNGAARMVAGLLSIAVGCATLGKTLLLW